MARLARVPSSPATSGSEASASPTSRRKTNGTADSQLSDKENRLSASRAASQGGKRRSASSAMSRPSPVSETPAATSSKRRRVEARTLPSQALHQRELNLRKGREYYDPDQNQEERRAVRKGMRDLAKDLNDSRAEYLQANSEGLFDTLVEADNYFRNVKQTSDATIDSRLLVTTADLSYKKTTHLALGDASTGIDVDDFVSRCVSYMRRGPAEDDSQNSTPPTSTQRNRWRQTQHHVDEDEDDSDTEDLACNWSYLGTTACFPSNSRPSLSGFLLGPLSLQKRARVQTQRRARQPRMNAADAIRPTELTAADLASTAETGNLTKICDGISKLLRKVQTEGQGKVEAEVDDDTPEEEIVRVMQKHGVSDDGGVPLMQFCVDPKSFGQTVENLFYVSFLIKEGAAGLNFDSRGLPTLHPHAPTPPQEAQARGITKNQAVFAIDFETWEDLISSFGVKQSLIPHRRDEDYDDGTGIGVAGLGRGVVDGDVEEDGSEAEVWV